MVAMFGIRFVSRCCGKTKFRRHRTWKARDVMGVTTDCPFCGRLLIIPVEQFEGVNPEAVPFQVLMEDFHAYLNKQDSRWPKDGTGTGYVEFPTD